MSRFSGKCDLYDHIAGMGGWFDKDGNPVTFGQQGVGAYYSDELLDFEAFKQATGGRIYQHYQIEVNEWNQNFVAEHCANFEIIKHEQVVPDARTRSGTRNDTFYTYKYYNTEYNLKDLNKHGIWIEVPIQFHTLLDLIPYYPYLVTLASHDNGKTYIVISCKSFVQASFEDNLQHGWISTVDYRKELQQHYLWVCQHYFLPKYEERVRTVPIVGYKPLHNGYYELPLAQAADYMHEVQFNWTSGTPKPHWSSPKLADPYHVLIAESDIDAYLAEDIRNGEVQIQYVEKLDQKPDPM